MKIGIGVRVNAAPARRPGLPAAGERPHVVGAVDWSWHCKSNWSAATAKLKSAFTHGETLPRQASPLAITSGTALNAATVSSGPYVYEVRVAASVMSSGVTVSTPASVVGSEGAGVTAVRRTTMPLWVS